MPAGGVISLFSKLHDVDFVRTDLSPVQQGDVPIYETSASKLFMGPGGTGGGTAQFSLGVSTGGNTAGLTGITGTRIVLAGGGEITLSQSRDANGATITASAPPQSVQTQSRFNLTLGGNTAGVLAEVSSGTLTLAGGPNITLSQNGNAITISGAAGGGGTSIAGIAASDTTYSSGTVSIVGSGDITVLSGTGQRVIISGSQSVQPETQTFIGGLSNSQVEYTSGTVRLGELGAITIRSTTGNQFQFSVNPQSVQPETQTFIAGIAASDTTYSSGTVRFTGVGGGVTVSSNTGQRVDISVAAPVAQSNQTLGAYALGNTTGESSSTTFDARTVSIRGDGAVSVGYSNGSLRISAPTQTVQTQNMVALTLSGNTAGAQALMSSGTVTIAGGNNITVSQNGNGFTISGPNVGGAQTGISGLANSETTYTSGSVTLSALGAITIRSTTGQHFQLSVDPQSVQSLGMYALGNTTGESSSTTFDARTVSLRGDGIVSLGYSNGSLRISASQSVQPETQTFIGGISASDTLYTSGTVRFTGVGGGITVSSNTGQRVDLSVAAPVNFSAGVSNLGNTAGDTGVTGTRLVLAGGQSVTLSQSTNANGGTITISGASTSQSNQTEGWYALGNTTGQSSSTTMDARTISIRGDGIVSVGYSNGSLRISASQSVQPETQTFIGGIAASDKTYTSGTVVLTGAGGGITVQSNAGQTITLSVAAPVAQTNQSLGMYALGNTTGQSSSTTMDARTLSLRGDGIVSLGYSNGSLRISATEVPQTNQSLGMYAVQNTTGQSSSTTMDARTISVAGDGAVSVGYSAGSLRISAPVQTGTQFSAGLSNIGNTAGDTGTVAGRLVLAGGNGITLSGSTNGVSETITVSGITQSVQTQNVHNVTLSGNTAGAMAHISSGTMTLAGGNNITLSQAGNAVTISGGAGGGFSAGVSNLGNTAGDTGVSGTRMVLAGINNITLSQSTNANGNTVSISGPTQTNQTLGMYAVQNTTGQSSSTTMDARTLSVAGDGAVSVGYSAGSLRISAPVQTAESQSIGMSNLGNTAGTTGVASGAQVRFVIVGSQNISLSQSLNGASGTISISGNPAFSGGVSNVGNTAGATGVSGTRLVLVGSNNITLSQTTDANGATVSFNAPSPGAAQYSVGVSNLGNTAGDTGVTGTRIVFAGTNNISLSQSTDATGATISINNTVSAFLAGASTGGNTAGDTGVTGTRLVFVGSSPLSLSQATGANGATLSILGPATSSLVGAGNITISTNGSTISVGDTLTPLAFWDNLVPGASTTFQLSDAGLHVFPLNPANAGFPGFMSVSSVFFDMSGTVSTAAAFTRSLSFGIYTLVNSTSLARLYSASTSWGTGAGNMNINDSMGGRRWVTLHSSQFDSPPNFHEGSDYYMAVWNRSSSGSQTFAYQGMLLPYATGVRSGFMSSGSSTNTTLGQYPFLGVYSISFTTGMPSALAASDVNKSVATAISLPRVIFNNVGSNIV